MTIRVNAHNTGLRAPLTGNDGTIAHLFNNLTQNQIIDCTQINVSEFICRAGALEAHVKLKV